MFEADLSRTTRSALLDDGSGARVEFARASVDQARAEGHTELVWHFAGLDSLDHLSGRLGDVAANLKRDREVTLSGVRITLATRRHRADDRAPAAAWWPDDAQILTLDSTFRPSLSALLSAGTRAPVWLTAFGLNIGEPVGVSTLGIGSAGSVDEIEVSAQLESVVTDHSGGMTLSTNGIHDSLGGDLLRAVRPMISLGSATPQAVAVAALRAGWWPRHIPDLIKKLG